MSAHFKNTAAPAAALGRILLVAFLLTGATSLIFEVIWTRLVLLSIGTTPTAISVVLGAFMGGMAIGSWVAGRWLIRYDPVRTYAWLEGWAGLYGLATPVLLPAVALVPPGSQIVLATVLLLPATVAMGASLPVLSRALCEGSERPAMKVGVLYAANTVGGVLGPLLAVFALFPWFGLHVSLLTVAVVNLIVCGALLAFRATWHPVDEAATSSAMDDAAEPAARDVPVAAMLLLTLGTSGATAMIYEVAWSRTLSMAYGSSVYGVSIMLSMFLLGLAGGSWIAALTLGRRRRPPTALALTWLLIGSACSAFVSLHLGRVLPLFFLELFRQLPQAAIQAHVIQFVLALLLMLPTTLCLGAMLPTAVAILGGRGQIGRSVARLYASNLVGSAAGAIAASALLVASVGIEASVRISALAALFVAFVLVVRQPRLHVITAATTALASVVIVALDGTAARVAQTFGIYAAAPAYAPYTDVGLRQVLAIHELLYYKDGPSATVAVQAVDKYRLLKINGKTDASNGAGDVQTQTLVAQLPLMATDARRVAIIGWGSGMTVGAALTHPVESIDAFEIEPAVVEASRHFEAGNGSTLPTNGNPLDDPRVRVIIGDARGELRRPRAPYDVIINQPSNPWLTGVANLFTRDYFELLDSRLAEAGVVCQWFQTYAMSEESTRTVMATFRSVFPHVVAFSGERDLVMLGSHQEIRFSASRLERRLRNPAIRYSLRNAFVTYPADLLVKLSLDQAGVEAFSAGAALNTDDNMRIELAAPRSLYDDRVTEIATAIAAYPPSATTVVTGYESEASLHLELASSYFTAGVDDRAMEYCERSLELQASFDGLKLLGQIAQRQGDTLRARNAYHLALGLGGDPRSRAFVEGLIQSLDAVRVSN